MRARATRLPVALLWLMRVNRLGDVVMRQDEQIKHIHALRVRADEVRAVAAAIHDKECRTTLVRLADSYESMIKAAQQAYATNHTLK
jgi:hypothetical protein